MAAKTYTTRPIAGLTKAVLIWTWITIGLLAVSSVGWAFYLKPLLEFPSAAPLASFDVIPGHEDDLLLAVGPQFLAVVTGLVLGFLVLRWCHRASRNTNAVARGVSTAPNWAIWWWFIPFAALFKPYTVFSEFWRVARDPDRWKSAGDPVRLRLWWGLHLAAGFAGIAVNGMDRAATTGGEVVGVAAMTVLMQGLQIAAALLFTGIVRDIGRGQTALIAEGRVAAPPDTAPAWAP